MTPSLPRVHAQFCDDVRREVGGFKTLVGIYAHNFTTDLPHTFLRLSVFVSGEFEAENPPESFSVRIEIGDEILLENPAADEFFRRSAANAIAKGLDIGGFNTVMTIEGFEVNEPILMKVVAKINGVDSYVGSLAVSKKAEVVAGAAS